MPNDEILQLDAPAHNTDDQIVVTPDSGPRRLEPGYDLADAKRQLKTQEARNAHLELDHLKKLLTAQEAAKQHAQSTAAHMQRQLKSLETDIDRNHAEIKRSQDQLMFARQEHSIELRRAVDRETALRNEVIELRAQATHALDKVSGHRKGCVAVAAVAAATVMIWGAVTFLHHKGDAGIAEAEPHPESVIAESAASQTASRPASGPTSGPGGGAQPAAHDFAGGLGRLDQAFDAFKGEQPESVLRRVRIQNAARGISVCAFNWNNGEVSLELGAKEGLNLEAAMTSCADAVEKAAK